MARKKRAGLSAGRFIAATAVIVTLSACDAGREPGPPAIPGADPERGRAAIAEYGCGSCHAIPGVRGADSYVAPPLERFAERGFIAGEMANNADNLVEWIQNPQQIRPGTGMPDMGVTPADARAIAAYLLSLD